jgi:hypothetical protein
MTFRIAIYETEKQEVLLGKPYSSHSISGLLAMLLESNDQFYVKRSEHVVIEKLDTASKCWVDIHDF